MFCRIADLIETLKRLNFFYKFSKASRKQKRKREQRIEQFFRQNRKQSSSKRSRISFLRYIAEKKLHSKSTRNISESNTDFIQYRIQNEKWRKKYFEQNDQIKNDFERNKSSKKFEKRNWLQKHCVKESFKSMHDFHHLHHLFAKKKFSFFFRRKNSKFNFQTFNDQLSRKIKNAQYEIVKYEIDLKKKSSYMCKYKNECKQKHLKKLLYFEQTIFQNSLFRDDFVKDNAYDICYDNKEWRIQLAKRKVIKYRTDNLPSVKSILVTNLSSVDN